MKKYDVLLLLYFTKINGYFDRSHTSNILKKNKIVKAISIL